MKIGEYIGNLAAQQEISLRQLAIKAGIPYNTLYAIVKRRSERIAPETLQKIATALNVPLHLLYGEKEILDVSTDLAQNIAALYAAVEIIKKDPETPTATKKVLDGIPSFETIISQLGPVLFSAKEGASLQQNEMSLWKKYSGYIEVLEKLNDKGVKVALERIQELSKISDYQKPAEN